MSEPLNEIVSPASSRAGKRPHATQLQEISIPCTRRLENKIKSLAEIAVNRQEPDYISSQVDQVAGSMLETEKTMNDLEFVTGLAAAQDETPHLLEPVKLVH